MKSNLLFVFVIAFGVNMIFITWNLLSRNFKSDIGGVNAFAAPTEKSFRFVRYSNAKFGLWVEWRGETFFLFSSTRLVARRLFFAFCFLFVVCGFVCSV